MDKIIFSQKIKNGIYIRNDVNNRFDELIKRRLYDTTKFKENLLTKLKLERIKFEDNVISFRNLFDDINSKFSLKTPPIHILTKFQKLNSKVNEISKKINDIDEIINKSKEKDYFISYNEWNHRVTEIMHDNIDLKENIEEVQFYVEDIVYTIRY